MADSEVTTIEAFLLTMTESITLPLAHACGVIKLMHIKHMKLGILIIDTTVMVLLIIFTYNVAYESASENLAYTVTTITIHRFNCQVLSVYSCTLLQYMYFVVRILCALVTSARSIPQVLDYCHTITESVELSDKRVSISLK